MGLHLTPLVALISTDTLLAILMAAFGLGFVIFVHELGHFLVAKFCGVKCEKFYVGFDVPIRIGPIQLPSALFRKKFGETEYGIGIIPLGGYVKMLGQDDNPANTAREAERIRVAREGSSETDPEAKDEALDIDPRSYPAKSVPQRLAIISAGVIMNLIFAVIFGMIAYRMGVSYTPTLVGATSPGLSAWNEGMQSGDRIVQMGREGKRSENLRFDKDMMVKVMMTGPEKELDLLVERYDPDTEDTSPVTEWVTVKLSSPQEELDGRPAIGISPFGSTKIGWSDEDRKLFAHLPVAQTDPLLSRGDEIVSIDGEEVSDYAQLGRVLARRVDDELTLRLRRNSADTDSTSEADMFEVPLPPLQMRWLGLSMEMGPVAAIQRNSPAEDAGFRIGDKIVSVNGEPVANPMLLPHQLRRLVLAETEEAVIVVEREGVDEPVQITSRLRVPTMFHMHAGPSKPISAEALGLAFTVLPTVASVEPGTPAAEAGLSSGDRIESVEFVAASPEDAELENELFGPSKLIVLDDDHPSWPHFLDRLQMSLPDTKVQMTFIRQGAQESVTLSATTLDGWHVEDRGLRTMTSEEIHQVTDWGTAFQLGFRETWESIEQVYFILTRLVTGRISPMNLGGPAAIATMAGMEASQSMARLLVFLTLLSANLAVLNFLPIPVLDGGHAMFLLYEGVFRRPVNERVAFGLTMAGFCFILGLMLFVIGLDIWRLSGLAG